MTGLPHSVSVVIPVYQGEQTLPGLLAEVAAHTAVRSSPDGHDYQVTEVLLVFDNGPDGSAATIRALAEEYPWVRPVWLSRNFGQHAATLAGMASSGAEWIVTMDEDGQHNPADIPRMLDTAIQEQATVVYGQPTNDPPHGALRNAASRTTKKFFSRVLASSTDADTFQSYRLVLGEIGRSVAAYAGAGVFLDVALGWVSPRAASCPIELRTEGGRASGYTMRRLVSHFWRLVLSSGTRGLRLVSILGVAFALLGSLLALFIMVARLTEQITVQGWASVMVVLLLSAGAILFSLGVIAEYIGVAVSMAMGKPLYLIVTDPGRSALARPRGSALARPRDRRGA